MFVFVFITCFFLSENNAEEIPGHLLYLGSHQPAEGTIEVTDTWPDPETFYKTYVEPGKPLLFKGKAKGIPAYNLWTDDYLRKQYGQLEVEAEVGKKEDRRGNLRTMLLSSFLGNYQKADIYMVQNMLPEMMGDFHIPKPILCGGYTRFLQDAVIWFSSGGTKSVLHFDNIDNINCLLDGSKELIFIDKKYSHLVEKDGFKEDGSYSTVDVEKVDMEKFPGFRNVPWWTASMEKGDCLFIPSRWYHHVSSAGPRNLAINIWFSHLPKFNQTDCKEKGELPESLPLNKFTIHSLDSNEQPRSEFLEIFHPFEERDTISVEEYMDAVRAAYDVNNQELMDMFGFLDINHDMTLDWEELFTFDIDKFIMEFPFLFNMTEEEETQGPLHHEEL
ncbi:jmjC domain-containing protein 5 [Lingula anatina]|uniref:JmjC domain-containing protein 5 n=1 Tax=Lingula anatina TaxID=7574 RepID=A0A1S3HFG8_LINAN|nr:jmjC domain-containing protein 5 [Lingula anatina]|eukprot:XP_013384785.1 jmjC domain-containing protein 5 [Lingula anatina]